MIRWIIFLQFSLILVDIYVLIRWIILLQFSLILVDIYVLIRWIILLKFSVILVIMAILHTVICKIIIFLRMNKFPLAHLLVQHIHFIFRINFDLFRSLGAVVHFLFTIIVHFLFPIIFYISQHFLAVVSIAINNTWFFIVLIGFILIKIFGLSFGIIIKTILFYLFHNI